MCEVLIVFSFIELGYLYFVLFCRHLPVNIQSSRMSLLFLLDQKCQIFWLSLSVGLEGVGVGIEVRQDAAWEILDKGNAFLVVNREHLVVPVSAAVGPHFSHPGLFQGQRLTYIVQNLVIWIEIAQVTVIYMFLQAVVTQFEHFVVGPVLKIRYRGHVLILFLGVTMSCPKVQSRRLNSHFRAV